MDTKKPQQKKLVLNKETIRNLEQQDLERAVGGQKPDCVDPSNDSCGTYTTCG